MNQTPEDHSPEDLQPTSPAKDISEQEMGEHAEQELTLEQLDADISDAEALHKSLSDRLDSIARD